MADVYRVGVAIGMTDNATQVIQALSRNILGLNASVRDVERNMGRLRTAALGLAAVLGADMLAKGLNSLADAGAKLLNQQTQMKNAGMTQLQIVRETERAYQSMAAVRGPDISERLAAIRELRSVVGAGASGNDYREINATLPDYLRVKAMIGDHGANDLFRAIEMQGAARYRPDGTFDLDRFHRYEDSALRTLQAGGGNIKPEDLLNAMQMSAVTARGYDPEAFWNLMMTPMLEMHGNRAGTALTAMSRAFYGGVMPERNARELERLGVFSGGDVRVLPHMSREQAAELRASGYTVGRGGVVTVGRGATRGAGELNDPNQGFFPWVRDVFGPLLQKDYQTHIATRPGNTESFDAYVRDEMYKALPTETARRFAALLTTQITSVERDQTLRRTAAGFDAYDNNQDNYQTQLDNLKNSWASLMQTLGLPAARDGAHLLHELGVGIDYLTRQAAAHPDAARNLVRFGAGLAAVTALSGGMAIAGVALGPLASGLRLLFSALKLAPAAAEMSGAAAAATGASTAAAGSGTVAATAAAAAASRRAAMLRQGGTVLAAGALAYGADQSARDARAQIGLRDPRVARWNQWEYDHTFGMLGVDMRRYAPPVANVTQPLPNVFPPARSQAAASAVPPTPDVDGERSGQQGSAEAHGANGCNTFVSVYLDSKQIAAQIMMRQQRDAQQDMRASGTAPDVLQHPQLPGRAIGR